MWKQSPLAVVLIYVGGIIAVFGSLGKSFDFVFDEVGIATLWVGLIFVGGGILVHKRKNPDYKPDPETFKKAPKIMIGSYSIGSLVSIVSLWHKIPTLPLWGQVTFWCAFVFIYIFISVITVLYFKKLYKKRMADFKEN